MNKTADAAANAVVAGVLVRGAALVGQGVVKYAPKALQRLGELTKGINQYYKKNASKNLPGNIGSNQTKIHKNSHDFEGPSHTYKIYDLTLKRVHKKGESSAGVRKRDGKSIRAEAQVRKLHRETGREFKSVIMHHFNNKKDAFYHQHELIKGMRKFWKEYDHILPGNKGNY